MQQELSMGSPKNSRRSLTMRVADWLAWALAAWIVYVVLFTSPTEENDGSRSPMARAAQRLVAPMLPSTKARDISRSLNQTSYYKRLKELEVSYISRVWHRTSDFTLIITTQDDKNFVIPAKPWVRTDHATSNTAPREYTLQVRRDGLMYSGTEPWAEEEKSAFMAPITSDIDEVLVAVAARRVKLLEAKASWQNN